MQTQTTLLSTGAQVTVGALTVTHAGAVTFHGKAVKLSAQESRFLRTLALNAGQPVKAASLMIAIMHGEDSDPDPEILKVLACKVRRKLSKVNPRHGIRTYVGTGYGLGEVTEVAPLAEQAPASFHLKAMQWLDSATYNGATIPGETHYALREALRIASMNGAPIQNETQWAEAAHVVAATRAMLARIGKR